VVGEVVLQVLRSTLRHRWLFLGLWVGVVAVSVGLVAGLPRTYQVETTLGAARAQVIPALTGTGRSEEIDAPTRAAADIVLRHDNLVAMIRRTRLIQRWPSTRAPLPKLKDWVWKKLFKQATDEEKLQSFVELLEKRLWVGSREGAVTIGIEFPDPDLAYELVDAALQSFLEARTEVEISSVTEAVGILEARADTAHGALETALQELEKLRKARASRLGIRPRSGAARVASFSLNDVETAKLVETVQGKRRVLADLEAFRRRRVTELETRLEEQRAQYSEPHPVVLDIHRSLEEARREAPEAAAIRLELGPLESELRRRGVVLDSAQGLERRELLMEATALESADPREDEDPDIDYAKSQVRHAMGRYNDLLDRIETARLDQDAARAAFKYRYVIIRPARRPTAPLRPKKALVLLASVVAGLFVATLGTAMADVRSGKVIEPWHVERLLGAGVLATMRQGQPFPAIELWKLLLARSWGTLGLVPVDQAPGAGALAEGLSTGIGPDHPRPLRLLDARGDGVAQVASFSDALRSAPEADGPRPEALVLLDSPLVVPAVVDALARCDLLLLLVDLDRTRLTDARQVLRWVPPERLLGVVLRAG